MGGLAATDKLEVLRRAARLLASATDFEATLTSTIEACLPALGDFGFFDVVVDGSPEHGVVRRTARAFGDPDLERLLAPTTWVRQERTDMVLCALSTGAVGLHPQIDDAWLRSIAVDDGHLELLRSLAFHSMLTVPMHYRDELVGSLTLFFARSPHAHSDEHVSFAQDLATLAVPAVVNARLVERHRRTEHALRMSEERLRLAADAGRLGLWDWNIPQDRVTWSDRVYDLHGLRKGEFGGTVADFARLVHPDDLPRVQQVMQDALARSATYALEFRAPRPDGSIRWLATRADIYRDATSTPVRMIGATFDITERVELLAAERAARDEAEHARADAERARGEAEDASRAKDEFLAILGHELRNPLAPIVAAVELMKRTDEPATRRPREVIERQVAHLSRLVDDLLDVSRIVRGKVELAVQPTSLVSIVDKALEMTGPLFDQRGVTRTRVLEPCMVNGDPVRLAQIVGNLLTNAAKFTPRGGSVAVTLRALPDVAELEVRDTGVGIAPDLLPHIFDLFVQGPQPLDRQQGGLGLGLAIVANLVERHGGSVAAESAGSGQGTTFRVRLPRIARTVASEPAQAPLPVPAPSQGRVLVVDDNLDAAELLAELLRARGYDVAVEASAPGALETAARIVPDLAILDIGLPEMDGFELARTLRANTDLAALRLVALTGYGRDADREASRVAGFDCHLVKPVAPGVLYTTVEKLLGR